MEQLGDLSNEDLLERVQAHVRNGHVWQAQLIAYLVEIEDRQLHLRNAYSSMWDLCLRRYGMSENEAQLRLAAARLVRKFPVALDYLRRGDIHLSGISTIASYLTPDNHEEILREAAGKSVRTIEAMLAARFPKPDVPPNIGPVAPQPELPVGSPSGGGTLLSPPTLRPEPRPRIEPLSAVRYRVELTISAEMKARLENIQDVMRHANPSGDLETIFGRALVLLENELERRRLGKTSRSTPAKEPRESKSESAATAVATTHLPKSTKSKNEKNKKSRPAIPRRVRREVFARDGHHCTYVDEHGNRCPARGFLELDHIIPKGRGGPDTVDNLRVRCRAHNGLHAEETYGREHVAQRIHYGRAKYAAAPLGGGDVAASGLRNLGFRETDIRRALARLETTLDANAPCETIVREALRLLT